MGAGRPKLLKSPQDMWALFQAYKKHEKDNPIRVQDFVGKDAFEVRREREAPLTMESFENFVADIDGMPTSLDHYFSNREGRYSEFVAICSRIKREIRADQIKGGMTGIYNPSITQRLNNLSEKQEISGNGGGPIQTDSTHKVVFVKYGGDSPEV